MFNWPDTFPPACPPSDAVVPPDGAFFRLVDGDPVTENDFRNHPQLLADGDIRARFWGDECIAAGLSLCRDVKDADALRQAVGPLRRKKVARGEIAGSGLTKKTHSNVATTHYTWWRPTDDVAWLSFTVVAA